MTSLGGIHRNCLVAAMHYSLVAYLGPHHMLVKANDPTLAPRMLGASREELDLWLALVEREGDVEGLADGE
ncbi:hypothetical protein [Pelomonas cellulosilytica]|uniref:Uncharacterized protein n=1 Tax=Pelomonas cellulosilytica TaxID=2906762 RepID=A0ABS8XZP0_9BURK|nr:hypothetical protein [Pelomonas sp. P8]MCE4558071.1 hypothetical protein [Pelomonas sp. P8]